MVVVRAFFLAGPISDEGCLCFLSSLADASSVVPVKPEASGGGPNGFSSGSSTSGAMGRYSSALLSSNSSSLQVEKQMLLVDFQTDAHGTNICENEQEYYYLKKKKLKRM